MTAGEGGVRQDQCQNESEMSFEINVRFIKVLSSGKNKILHLFVNLIEFIDGDTLIVYFDREKLSNQSN